MLCLSFALSVANLLCPNKRSLVCGVGEEVAEDRPLSLSIFAPELLLENCDQTRCCAVHAAIRRLAFLFSTTD